MKKKTKQRLTVIVASVLVLLLVLPLILSAVMASAGALSSREQLQQLKDEAAYLEQRKEEVQNEIAALEQQQLETIEAKALLDERIIVTTQEIINANAQLQQYTIIIADMQKDIDEAILAEREQFELFKTRVRAIEENGTASYWSYIFGAESLSDLLDRVDFVNELVTHDENVINGILTMRAELDAAQLELEENKAGQKAIKDELVILEADLAQQRAEADELVIRLQQEVEGLEAYYAGMEEQEVAVAAEIDALIAKIEEEERLAKLNGTSSGYATGTGNFTWPTPSCTYITSPYGWRMHPTLGVEKFHNGVDIGASYGASIVAADSGTVIVAGYNSGGYGNYIVISHGDGMSTLYGHLSSFACSTGDNVTKGDVIGYVGSTGRSTGPHLHFEIRQNGQYLDPLGYFSF